MYNLLFVDDDKWITDSIRSLLDWSQFQFHEPFLSYNVKNAKMILSSQKIHVLITDIEMLGEDGFSLVEWSKSNCPETICIFLTNHAKFEYARKAITVGAFEYLLKPVTAPHLEEILRKCLAQFSNRNGKPSSSALSPLVASAISYIEENLSSPLSREGIAKALFTSESTLSHYFVKETGSSLVDYITSLRIQKAKELLAETELSITQISIEVGYNYSAYFTKIFRERENQTPKQYRESSRL
ncbi:MAG: helix-turn-helix domain-containing protein [Blautia sp.]|nr:helix-turn-helix domain-containing protein [Blautia sp.]